MLVACVAVAVFFVFYFVSYPVLINLLGVQVEGELTFWANWRANGLAWLVGTTLFFMVIVGPVEELFHRGFIQDQINRAFSPWFGILVASTVFVLGHVPIDFMVYKLDLAGWGLRWLSSFPFAIGAGDADDAGIAQIAHIGAVFAGRWPILPFPGWCRGWPWPALPRRAPRPWKGYRAK